MSRSHRIAWAAGFLDGEGSFYAYAHAPEGPGRCPKYRVGICAVQVERAPLHTLQELLGGRVRAHTSGAAAFPQRARSIWVIEGGARVREVLQEIRPYLVAKADQADLLSGLVGMMSRGNRSADIDIDGRAALIDALSEAKHRVPA